MYLKEFHIYVKTQLKEKKENSFNVILFKYCVPHILMYVSQKLVHGFVNNLLFSKLFFIKPFLTIVIYTFLMYLKKNE